MLSFYTHTHEHTHTIVKNADYWPHLTVYSRGFNDTVGKWGAVSAPELPGTIPHVALMLLMVGQVYYPVAESLGSVMSTFDTAVFKPLQGDDEKKICFLSSKMSRAITATTQTSQAIQAL